MSQHETDTAESPESLIRVWDLLLDHWLGEVVTESPDSAENREGSPNKPEKNRAGSGKSRDSSPLREEAPSAGNLPESPRQKRGAKNGE